MPKGKKDKKPKVENKPLSKVPKAEKPIGVDDVRRIVRETVDDSLEEYRRTGYIECPTDKILCKLKDGKAICPVCKAKFDGDHWNLAKKEEPKEPEKAPEPPPKPKKDESNDEGEDFELRYD